MFLEHSYSCEHNSIVIRAGLMIEKQKVKYRNYKGKIEMVNTNACDIQV